MARISPFAVLFKKALKKIIRKTSLKLSDAVDSFGRLVSSAASALGKKNPVLVPIPVKKIPTGKKGIGHRGQASVEYLLVLMLVFFVGAYGTKKITLMLDTGILKVGGQLEKQLKSGRVQLNTWRN